MMASKLEDIGELHICLYKLSLSWLEHFLISFTKIQINNKFVTGFAKRGLIHASDFATLMRHNFICGSAMKLKFTVSLV